MKKPLFFVWERYLFKELLSTICLCSLSFFLLYALLDYSTHADDFFQNRTFQLSWFLSFYRDQWIKRADLLLPLSFTIASIRVLTSMNLRREWLILQTASISSRRVLAPFFIVGAVFTLSTFLSFEFFLPQALKRIDQFRATHFKTSKKAKYQEHLHLFSLEDGSKLIYQSYLKEKDVFFDLFWVKSSDDIWKIKYLQAVPQAPTGFFVDHLVRLPSGEITKVESFDSYNFTSLHWEPKMLGKAMIPFESRSISELYTLLKHSTSIGSYETAKITTQLYQKSLVPFLSIIMLLAITPYCIRFSRNLPLFLIYGISLFGFLAFYMAIDAGVILGENGLVHPSLSLLLPIATFGLVSFLVWRKKIR